MTSMHPLQGSRGGDTAHRHAPAFAPCAAHHPSSDALCRVRCMEAFLLPQPTTGHQPGPKPWPQHAEAQEKLREDSE